MPASEAVAGMTRLEPKDARSMKKARKRQNAKSSSLQLGKSVQLGERMCWVREPNVTDKEDSIHWWPGIEYMSFQELIADSCKYRCICFMRKDIFYNLSRRFFLIPPYYLQLQSTSNSESVYWSSLRRILTREMPELLLGSEETRISTGQFSRKPTEKVESQSTGETLTNTIVVVIAYWQDTKCFRQRKRFTFL